MKTKNNMLTLNKIALPRFALLFAIILSFLFSCSLYKNKIDKQTMLQGIYNSLEAALDSPSEVEYLILNDNTISTLPEDFFDMKSLIHLRIRYHDNLNLKDLFEKVSKHENLKELGITHYNLEYLPDEMLLITNINKLSLTFSKNLILSDLFIKISQLPDLEQLYLTFGDFESLPSEIRFLTNIKLLGLGAVPIKDFPEEMNTLNLEILYFCQFPHYFRALSKEEKIRLLNLLPNTEIILYDYGGPYGKAFILGKREVKLTRDNLWEVKN